MKIPVRFLRTKRYPHPDGPKRHPGELVDVDDATAERWIAVGLVERDVPEAPRRETPPVTPEPPREPVRRAEKPKSKRK